jgi:hypothetical protein
MRKLVAVVATMSMAAGAAGAGSTAFAHAGSTQAGAAKKRCHKSYRGRCLKPNAYDYDCIGGSGNGPYYTGLVRVVGPDVYRLDADGDGLGCE